MCLIGLKVSSSGAFSSFVYPFALSLSPFLFTFHGTKLNVSLNQSAGRAEWENEAKNQYRN
jgi:hypothetical protein